MSIKARYLDGIQTLELTMPLNLPLEASWNLISKPEYMGQWFPFNPRFEPAVGATIYFTGDQYAPDTQGTVLNYSPYSHFAFDWGGSSISMQLEQTSTGVLLTLQDGLSSADEAARNAAGWEQCLHELATLAVTGTANGPHAATAVPWRPLYEKYVQAGFPYGAEVPSI